MFRKSLLALAFALLSTATLAQNTQCSNRPAGDSSNACANTRFVGTALGSLNLVVGGTTISGGVNTRILGDNVGVLGEYAVSGTGNVALTGGPTFTGTITAALANFSGAVTAPSLTSPIIAGGSAASSSLTLESTSGTGTSDSILFKTGSQVTRGQVATGGQWVIGPNGTAASNTPLIDINNNTSSPTPAFSNAQSHVRILAPDAGTSIISLETYGNQNQIFGAAAGGTAASPSATGTGVTAMNLSAVAWDGSIWGNPGGSNASISLRTAEAQTGTAHGFLINFTTTPIGSTTRATAMTVGSGLAVGSAAVDPGAGIVNATTGYRIANAATLANVLRGDGTNFVSAQLGIADTSGYPASGTTTTTAGCTGGGTVSANATINWIFKVYGKLVWAQATMNPTHTCVTSVNMPLPSGTSRMAQTLPGQAGSVGASIRCYAAASSTSAECSNASGTPCTSATSQTCGGWYEIN